MAILKKSQKVLKFRTPATLWGAMWREGLPTGNGTIGASVLGGAGFDTITINHNDLWWHGKTGVLPDVSDKLRGTKTALQNENYVDAQNVLLNALIAKSYRPQPSYPLPVCDLKVEMDIEKKVTDYSRSVNMENGEVSVSFKDKNTRFDRNLFISRANDTVFMQITKAGSKQISCSLKLDLHDKFYNRTPNAIAEVPDNYESKAEQRGYFYFSCRNSNGTDYGAVAKVVLNGGSFSVKEDGTFAIKNADKVLVMIKVFVEGQKEKDIQSLKDELSLIKLPYEKLLREHANIHNKLFNTCTISLNAQDVEYVDDLLVKAKEGNVPNDLIEKLYHYGRYLFICSAPVGEVGAHPYGLFNGDYRAVDSTRNNYLQAQNLYNFAFNGNIPQLVLPLLKQYYNNIDDYKKNATRLFNCRGIFIPTYEAPESGLLGSVTCHDVLNFNVAAYVCQMFYEYYLHTDDVKFLKETALEFFVETATFYEDLLKLNKTTKTFESLISYAENTPINCLGKSEEVHIASNAVADFVCANQVFSILTEVGKVAGLDEEDIKKWEDLATKLPSYEIDDAGVIKEFNSNLFETNNNLPGVAHLFPYNVGAVAIPSRKDFEKSIANTAKVRLANSRGNLTAQNILNLAISLASTGDSAASMEALQLLIQNFTTKNLVFANTDWTGMGISKNDRWAAYSITNNTGLCLALQNMFVNSNKTTINLFKNIAPEINKINVQGLVLDNQIRVDMEINRRRGVLKLKLKAPKANNVKLFLPEGVRKVKGIDINLVDLENQVINNLNLPGNKAVNLKISWSNKI